MTKDETLKLALEALERCVATCFDPYSHEQAMSGSEHFVNQTITAIKEALAQPEHGWTPERIAGMARLKEAQDKKLAEPEQEPVAWISATELLVMRGNALGGAKDWRVNLGLEPEEGDVGLYTIPLQRTWVGLTRTELIRCGVLPFGMSYQLYEAIETKLKEKNT